MTDYDLRRHIAEILKFEGGHGFRAELGALDDTGEIQTVTSTGYAGEELKNVMRVQPHGFSSSPPTGSHGLVFPLRGERILGAALGFEHQDKRQKNLPAGTAVLYDDQGNVMRAYGKDGIQVEAASGDIYVKPAQGKNLYHGGNGKDGSYKRVMLEDGSVSVNVFAKAG